MIDRAKFQPKVIGEGISSEDVAFLGVDPGPEIDEAWWDDMLVAWFGAPEEEEEPQNAADDGSPTAEESENASTRISPTAS